MVVKSIFLNLWIFPIRHLPTIMITQTLQLGEGGSRRGAYLAHGTWDSDLVTTQTSSLSPRANLINMTRADKCSSAAIITSIIRLC